MSDEPRCLILPGLGGSGPDHWQSRWEAIRHDCRRIDLGAWSNPHRSHWITKLDLAIAYERAPVILVAHSLGCLAVAWWTTLAADERRAQVKGALLVAPPDVERSTNVILQRFAPWPRVKAPFPTIVVASADDPYASIDRSEAFARRLGADFCNVGSLGHINADTGLGDWPEGQALLQSLGAASRRATGSAGRILAAPHRGRLRQ